MKKILILILCFATINSLAAKKFMKPENAEFLRGVLRYIYFWHLDPAHFFEDDPDTNIEVYVKKNSYSKDLNNNSIRYELIIPDLNLGIDLVKANYKIRELDLQITNSSFKVVAVNPDFREPITNKNFQVRLLSEGKMMKKLFQSRYRPAVLSGCVKTNIYNSLVKLSKLELGHPLKKSHVFFVGPLSDYSNDIWIFWETERKLVRFSSASDYTSKAYWQLLPIYVKIYDLDSNVVVSLSEVSGSNAYITKSFAGRIMFNCIVEGKKIIIKNQDKITTKQETKK
ncbi:MAG: hypothetical protein DRI44_00425 [Chlamydiae bacterium]|nr:MAG: hypothetical protein DRI44_00425 [Chlamydiota bacterium]